MRLPYIDKADLVRVAGAATVDRMFDEDGDGRAEARTAEEACESASALADSYLQQGWPDPDARAELLRGDELLRRHLVWIALHFRAQTKSEWRDQTGGAQYRLEYQDAIGHLDRLAKAKARSRAEDKAGGNVQARGRVTHGTPQFFFAPSARDPKGPGGF